MDVQIDVNKCRAASKAQKEAEQALLDMGFFLKNAYECEECHDALRKVLGSDGFRALEVYVSKERVKDAAFEEWVNA